MELRKLWDQIQGKSIIELKVLLTEILDKADNELFAQSNKAKQLETRTLSTMNCMS